MKRFLRACVWFTLVTLVFSAGLFIGDLRLRCWRSESEQSMRLFSAGVRNVMTALATKDASEELHEFIKELPTEMSRLVESGDYDRAWLGRWFDAVKDR